MVDPEEFGEDEPIEDVLRAYEGGLPMLSVPPSPAGRAFPLVGGMLAVFDAGEFTSGRSMAAEPLVSLNPRGNLSHA